jgi:hypothetical protein
MKIGDSVKVKDGIKEPDNEDFEMSGWQGHCWEKPQTCNSWFT